MHKKGENQASPSFLRRIPLFRGIPTGEIEGILSIGKRHRILPQQKLELRPFDGRLYVVIAGSANIMQIYMGQETFLFSVEAAEFFGSPPLSKTEEDFVTQAVANSPCDVIEFQWKALIKHLQKRTQYSALFLERMLTAAAQKFSYLSREYCHLVQQAGVPEDIIETLFPPPRPDCIRSDEQGGP